MRIILLSIIIAIAYALSEYTPIHPLLALTIAIIFPFWASLKIFNIIRLKKTPTDKLVDSEETIPWTYFDYIGRETPAVIEYTNLVKEKDYKTILKKWDKFEVAFVTAESLKGHRGRPLIMDYYFGYKSALREYQRRTVT